MYAFLLMPRTSFLTHLSVNLGTPSPHFSLTLISGIFYWDFFLGYPIFTTEIQHPVSLHFLSWMKPHCIHTRKWTFIQVHCDRGWHCGYVLFSLQEKSRKALYRLDLLLLLEPSMWIASSQTHSQKLRITDVCLLFESQGRKYPLSLDWLPSSQPNRLKLADFSRLVAELVKWTAPCHLILARPHMALNKSSKLNGHYMNGL